jgi:hypothetical protein
MLSPEVAAVVNAEEEGEAVVATVEEEEAVATVGEEEAVATVTEEEAVTANAKATTTTLTTQPGEPCPTQKKQSTLPNAKPRGVRQLPLELAVPAKSLLKYQRNPHPLN